MSNNCDTYNNKSNIAKTLQEDNFIPFEKIDPDALIDALEEDITYHITDEIDEWCKSVLPGVELRNTPDDDTFVTEHIFLSTNDDDKTVDVKPFDLTPQMKMILLAIMWYLMTI